MGTLPDVVQHAAGHVTTLSQFLLLGVTITVCLYKADLGSTNEGRIGRKQYASSGGTGKRAGHLPNKHPRKLRDSSHPGTIPVVGTSPLTAAFARVASAQ